MKPATDEQITKLAIDEAHSRAISAHALAKSRGEWADTLQGDIRALKDTVAAHAALLAEALPYLEDERDNITHEDVCRGSAGIIIDLVAKIEAAIGSTMETGDEA